MSDKGSKDMQNQNSKSLPIILNKMSVIALAAIICGTIVLLSAIGAGAVMWQRQLDQKDRQYRQQKELVEYEQTQLNHRNYCNMRKTEAFGRPNSLMNC